MDRHDPHLAGLRDIARRRSAQRASSRVFMPQNFTLVISFISVIANQFPKFFTRMRSGNQGLSHQGSLKPGFF